MFYGCLNFGKNLDEKKPFFPLFYNSTYKIHFFQDNSFYGEVLMNPLLPHGLSEIFFSNKEKDVIVLFFGSIFNRPELQIKFFFGKEFTDPELVANLFSLLGEDFVNELNGDFSFVIFSPKKKQLWLFRDHLGVKPLAYKKEGDIIWFSTDYISICRYFQWENEKINLTPLFTDIGIIDSTESFHYNVKKVLPGHSNFFSINSFRKKKYWEPEKIKIDKTLNYSNAVEKLNHLLNDSVLIRCDKKFNSGSHISGGLDSSAIAVLARKTLTNQKKFFAFSYAPKNHKTNKLQFDERLLITSVCKLNDIFPVFSSLDQFKYKDLLNNSFKNHGFFWEEEVREKASKLGVNLIFSGWGGDEFISSGFKGYDIELFLKFKWIQFLKKNPFTKPRSFISTTFNKVFLPYFGKVSPSWKKSFHLDLRHFNSFYKIIHKKSFKNYFKYKSKREVFEGILNNYYLAERTEMWCVHGFNFGIEYRYPLLDKRIIEFVLSIPSDIFLKKNISRVLFRDVIEGILPDEIRLNKTKLDDVLHDHFSKIRSALSEDIINELDNFKINPDLDFVNFNLLEKDIKKNLRNPENEKYKFLSRNLFFIKMLHEFTKTYRSLPQASE